MQFHHWVLIAVAIIGAVIYFRNKKDDVAAGVVVTPAPTPVPVARVFKGKVSGRIEPPNHAERIRLRTQALTEQGKPITGDDAVDNAATGGGGVDGGVYLDGAYEFEVDQANNVKAGWGRVIVHGYTFSITGGAIRADGSFDLGVQHGLPFSGKIGSNNIVTGKVTGLGHESYHYGNVTGNFEPNKTVTEQF
jgi:hypothetical protein